MRDNCHLCIVKINSRYVRMRHDKSRLYLERIKMKKFKNKYRIPSARLENWDYGANGAYFITICTHKMQHYFGEVLEREMQLNELGKLAHDLWQEITNQFPYVELGNFVIMPNHMHGILIINKSVSVMTVETRSIASPPVNINADPNLQLNNSEYVKTRFIASPHENEDADSPLIDSQIIDPPLNNNNDNNNNDINPQLNDNATVETRLIASVLDPQLIDHEIALRDGGIAGYKNPMLNENISRIIRWYKGRCSFEMRKIHADFKWHSRFHDHIIRNSKSFETIQTYIENNPSKWGEDKFHK